MKQKLVYIVIAIVVTAILLYAFLNTGNEANAPVINEGNTNTQIGVNTENPANVNGAAQSPLEASKKNLVRVSAQEPGTQVTIDNYYLEKPGFIVIHESENDLPGKIVASSGHLGAGPGQDLIFKANLKPKTIYNAIIYEDNGDKKFDAATDRYNFFPQDGNVGVDTFYVE